VKSKRRPLRVTYRVARDIGRCKDCKRITHLTGGWCGECARKHGLKVKPRFGYLQLVERRK